MLIEIFKIWSTEWPYVNVELKYCDFCRYHYNVDGRRKHVLPQEGKFVLTQDQGLVIIGLADQDAGQYDCRVNHQTINSYR